MECRGSSPGAMIGCMHNAPPSPAKNNPSNQPPQAVGVKVKRWHTMHGVALNVDPPMEYFRHIVPCGIADRPVACLADFVPGACSHRFCFDVCVLWCDCG